MPILIALFTLILPFQSYSSSQCRSLLYTTATKPASKWVEESLTLEPGRKIYFRHNIKAKNAKNLVLLNGLIYKNAHWDQLIASLVRRSYNIIQISYSTHPESLGLLKADESAYYAGTPAVGRPSPVSSRSLASEVGEVMNYLGIAKAEVVSLSYSSTVAMALSQLLKDRINQVILMSPAVRASHRHQPGMESLHQGFALQMDSPWAFWNPIWKTTVDYNYDLMLKQGMRDLMYSKKDKEGYVPEGLSFESFFEGTYQMGRAAKWFELGLELAQEGLPRVSLLIAGKEKYREMQDMTDAWKQIHPSRKGDLIFMEGASHAMVKTHPEATAAALDQILSANGEAEPAEAHFAAADYENGKRTAEESYKDLDLETELARRRQNSAD